MIHVGIDLHTRNMVNVAINDNAEQIKQAKLPTSRKALYDFFRDFDEPVQAVVECTSSWYWLSDWCRANGVPLTLAHAKMVKAISYAKVKTDKVDARTLAELLRAGLIPEAYQVGPERRALRELTRGRLRMIQRPGKLQSRLWSQAAKYNVHIDRNQWRYPDELVQWLQSQLPEVATVEAELLVDQILQLQSHIHRLEQMIERREAFSGDLELIKPIPGIGLVNGWSILAEIGDIGRFPSDKQFVSYSRLVPGSSDSGGARRHKSGSKDGNKYLRVAFGQAAICAYTHYKPVKQFYRKIKRRSGRHVARAVVAKELAKIVWHVLSKQEPYKGFSRRDPLGKRAAHAGDLSSILAPADKPVRLTGTPSPRALIGESAGWPE